VQYIGCLSRFTKKSTLPKEYDLLVMLSGPEPQRSILEKKIIHQLRNTYLKVAMVRGLPGETIIEQHSGITAFNHLPSEKLNRLIVSSSMVLARCGYSTVMDLALLDQKAILIPTPGQGEQEYLAVHLSQKKYFLTVAQDKLDIEKNMKEAENFDFNRPDLSRMKEEEIYKSLGFADQT
jgi:UDP-N-acetylglucosamine:LPS N-acetylglucosamine transferase